MAQTLPLCLQTSLSDTRCPPRTDPGGEDPDTGIWNRIWIQEPGYRNLEQDLDTGTWIGSAYTNRIWIQEPNVDIGTKNTIWIEDPGTESGYRNLEQNLDVVTCNRIWI